MMELTDSPVWGLDAVFTFEGNMPVPGSPEERRLTRRPGEVLMVLITSQGSVWLHTKEFYPQGLYRLPTGGLKKGESPEAGFRRELLEETGMNAVSPPHALSRISYRRDRVAFPFKSYLYALSEVDDQPDPSDSGEQISGWRRATLPELADVARKLRELPLEWRSWGVFRAVGHEVVVQALQGNRSRGKGTDTP